MVAPYASEPPTPSELTVLYQDASLLVIDKPAGLPTHPSSCYHIGTVVNRLRQRFGQDYAWPVHRLDRETSGVMVCARSKLAARRLSQAFAARQVTKTYLAICEKDAGPSQYQQRVDAPIAVGGPRIRIGVRIDPLSGQPAQTELLWQKNFTRGAEPFSLWQARPRHGRRHQVRVHLKHAGWPIVGDKIYGPCDSLYEAFIASQLGPAELARLRLGRQALHASAVQLPHPDGGAEVSFCAPLPQDMVDFMAGH